MGDLGAPSVIEATGTHDEIKAIPRYGVESFPDVKFEDCGRDTTPVAVISKVCCINKIFSNISPMNETSLVRVDQGENLRTKPVRENLDDELHGAIL